MVSIRPVRPDDIEQLYAISLRTGHLGKDATPLHRDGRLIGHIYSAPYAALLPELVFVAEDDEGIFGYISGAFDTAIIAARGRWRATSRAVRPVTVGVMIASALIDSARSHRPCVI